MKQSEFCPFFLQYSSSHLFQIKNETSYAMGIYYKRSALETLGYDLLGESTNPFEDTNRIAIIEPDDTFNVPLIIAHHCKLYILPAYVE